MYTESIVWKLQTMFMKAQKEVWNLSVLISHNWSQNLHQILLCKIYTKAIEEQETVNDFKDKIPLNVSFYDNYIYKYISMPNTQSMFSHFKLESDFLISLIRERCLCNFLKSVEFIS